MYFPEMDYFLNDSISDVVFIIEGQRLPAIKSILSLKSPVFRALFSGNLCETQEFQESKSPEIEIKDTTFDAFKTLIHFIYTDVLVLEDPNDWSHISDVYQLSDRYEVLRLRQRVVHHLDLRILFNNINDLIPITRIVFNHNIEELVPKVMAFLKNNINKFDRKFMNELQELNDSTNDKLFNALAAELWGWGHFAGSVCLRYGKPSNYYFFRSKDTTFMAFKTLIGLIYFDRISEDFQLIREVCDMCNTYHNKPLMEVISDRLLNKINVENFESISGIASDFAFEELIEKVNQMKISSESAIDWSDT